MAEKIDNRLFYKKPFLNAAQQLEKLKADGMLFHNETLALSALKSIGYYRLSGYWFPFQEINADGKKLSRFKADIYFEEIIRLYRFDEKLRHILLTALADFEISLRASWAYYFAEIYSPTAYCDPLLYKRSIDESIKTLTLIKDDFSKSKERSITHYKNQYNQPPLPPTWIIAEILSFGTVIKLIDNLADKRLLEIIADKAYALENEKGLLPAEFSACLRHLGDIRNICAHCNRLWNRELRPQIPILKKESQ